MIKLSGRLVCKSQEEANIVRQYLPEHKRLTEEEAGCISFEVAETDSPLVWKVAEIFSSQTTFDNHQKRTKASAWGKATGSIIREYQITEIG